MCTHMIEKPIFGVPRHLANLVWLCLCLVICSCASEDLPVGKLDGSILMWGTKSYVIDMESVRKEHLKWTYEVFRPAIECIGHRDTLIVTGRGPIGGWSQYRPQDHSSSPVYKYALQDSIFTLVPELADKSFYCNSIDYDSVESRYLYCGKYRGQRGVIILDSVFKLVEDISNRVPNELPRNFIGRFLGSNKILYANWDGGTFLIDLETGTHRRVSIGTLMDISADHRVMLVRDGPREKPTGFSIYDVDTWERKSVKLSKLCKGIARLSPDAKYIAFTKLAGGFLDDFQQLMIHNIAEGRTYGVEAFASRGTTATLLWLPAPIDAVVPVAQP